jgi:hypothetical protein
MKLTHDGDMSLCAARYIFSTYQHSYTNLWQYQMYEENVNSAFKYLEGLAIDNVRIVSITHRTLLQNIQSLFDLQVKIASYFVGWWNYEPMAFRGNVGLHELLFSSFHKNLFDYFSAIKLTTEGLHGSSRTLLRKIFEWLIIAKFSNISHDTKVLENWCNNETIYFTNGILKKISSPDTKPFYDFWNIVCDSAHATKLSGQVYLKIDDEMLIDVKSTLVILAILLECSYHMLNSQLITPQLSYMAKYYYSHPQSERAKFDIPELRKESHSIFKSNRHFFSKDAIQLISTYKKKWAIKYNV